MSYLHRVVGKFVWKLGCPSKYDGYRYVIDGICIALESGAEIMCLRKSIYEQLAVKYKTCTHNIERSIRHFIGVWWVEHQCGQLFGKRPTNSELICYFVEYIRLRYGACKICSQAGLLVCECDDPARIF